jgi:choline kinase
MRGILLAAGRGRRLGIDGPKVMLRIGGRTLLERHLDAMAVAGMDALTVVVGHGREEIHAELERIASRPGGAPPVAVETVFNELYVHGSLVSLQRAAHWLERGAIWMDADVIYPAELLARLVRSRHACAVLLDGRSSEQGEEMMIAVRDGRVRRIARRVGTDWDRVGESVGFFKVDPAGGRVLKRILDAEVAAGRLDQEHEDGLDRALGEVTFGHERVDDLAWTEIDFPEDVVRAEQIARALTPPDSAAPSQTRAVCE